MGQPGKWILARDDSAHWYLIPADQRERFTAWVEWTESEDGEEYEGLEFDDYRLNMHPSNYVFEGVWSEAKD